MVHKHGGDIYSCGEIRDFSANINYRGMPETVRRSAYEAVEACVHYPDPAYRALRTALAAREGCSREHLICGNGAAELMFALASARRPKKAVLAVPSFFEYEQALLSCGCEIHRVHMERERGFTLEASFVEAVNDQTDIVIVGNPNNPTGRLIDSTFLDRLCSVCRRHSALLVLDESFFDFLNEEDTARTYSGIQSAENNPGIFVLRSFTKMYAIPGLRFGYGVCSDTALLEEMRMKLQPWNVSVVAAQAAQAAAAELPFAKETAVRIGSLRSELKGWMEQSRYRVYPSNANFLLFEGPQDLQEFCLSHGYLIRDCSNFPGLDKGFYRVCVRSREENAELMKVLKLAADRPSDRRKAWQKQL